MKKINFEHLIIKRKVELHQPLNFRERALYLCFIANDKECKQFLKDEKRQAFKRGIKLKLSTIFSER